MAASKSTLLFKPGMMTLAAVALWSARHEPDSFSVSSVGIWLLGAVTTALIVRAALALGMPLFRLCFSILGQAYQTLHNGAPR